MLRDRPVRALTVGNLNIVCGIVTLLTVNRMSTTLAVRVVREQRRPATPGAKKDQ